MIDLEGRKRSDSSSLQGHIGDKVTVKPKQTVCYTFISPLVELCSASCIWGKWRCVGPTTCQKVFPTFAFSTPTTLSAGWAVTENGWMVEFRKHSLTGDGVVMFFIKGLLTFLPAVPDVMKMDVSFIDCGPRRYDSCQVAVRCQHVKAIWIKAHVLCLFFFSLFTLPFHRRGPSPPPTAPPSGRVVFAGCGNQGMAGGKWSNVLLL